MRTIIHALAVLALAFGMTTVHAQEATSPATNPMDHSHMDHGSTGQPPAADSGGSTHDHGTQRAVTPLDETNTGLRDPHAYSGGHELDPVRPHLADDHPIGSFLADKLEAVHSDGNTSAAYDLQAWYGWTYDRAVLKAEGSIASGTLEEARTELLWSHAIATFWDAQTGVRHDAGEGPDRKWLSFGVQGLAPYWFEIEAAGYVGEEGRTALRLHASYELLLTQKLILQPRIEANVYGKADAERGLGSGLSDVIAGLRLRYEIRREFAPYLGIEYAAKFGGTADFARAADHDPRETRAVAGFRFWF